MPKCSCPSPKPTAKKRLSFVPRRQKKIQGGIKVTGSELSRQIEKQNQQTKPEPTEKETAQLPLAGIVKRRIATHNQFIKDHTENIRRTSDRRRNSLDAISDMIGFRILQDRYRRKSKTFTENSSFVNEYGQERVNKLRSRVKQQDQQPQQLVEEQNETQNEEDEETTDGNETMKSQGSNDSQTEIPPPTYNLFAQGVKQEQQLDASHEQVAELDESEEIETGSDDIMSHSTSTPESHEKTPSPSSRKRSSNQVSGGTDEDGSSPEKLTAVHGSPSFIAEQESDLSHASEQTDHESSIESMASEANESAMAETPCAPPPPPAPELRIPKE